jgi:hypothetical protein
MPASKVIVFGEPTGKMSYAEGLTFIERTRRQLDRFKVAMPRAEGQGITPEDDAAIRQQLDELERDLHKDLGYI